MNGAALMGLLSGRTARMIFYIVGSAISVLFHSPAFSEWHISVEEAAEGTRCVLTNWSSYQEPADVRRDRSSISLTVHAFEPFAAEIEVDSGFHTSLKTIGILKIDATLFVLDFVGRIGKLRDSAEHDDLIRLIRRGIGMPALFRNSQRNSFDNFIIRDLDKKLLELRKECLFIG